MPAVDFDLRQVNKAFKRLEKSGANLRPLWREVRKPFKKAQGKHIAAKKQANGSPWEPLAKSTLIKRLHKGGSKAKYYKNKSKGLKKKYRKQQSAILSKRMLNRSKVRMLPGEMSLTGSGNKFRSHLHQFGGKVGPRANSRLPKREYIFVDDSTMILVKAKLTVYLAEAFNSGK